MASRSKQKRIALAEKAEEPKVTPMRSDAERKKAALGELGASGTIIQSGQIRAESNSKLLWALAHGLPATPTWGEWQKLARTDPAVATALNKVVAPLRDSKVEIEPAEAEKPKAKRQPKGEEEEGEVAGFSAVAPSDPERLDRGASTAGSAQEDDTAEGESLADPDEDLNQRIADYVSDCFNKWLTPTISMHIEQVVRGGLGDGFALHEPVFGVREDERVPGGQAVYVRKMAQRLPNSIEPNGWIEKDGDLSVIRQQGYVDGKWVRVDLPADRVQLATWDRNGNNYAGFPAFRSVWYLGLLRAEMLRIIGVGHQREACGVPVATMDKDTVLTDAVRDELQELLETVVFHENAGFQLPPGVKVEWFFSPGANKGNVLETWRQLGIAILQVVGAEGSELGMGEAGTRSLGETKAAEKNGFIEGVRSWLEGVFNGVGEWPYTGIVRKLVDYNFGPQKAYPTLKLVTPKGDLSVKEAADATAVLVTAGILRPTRADENHFRSKLGLDRVDEVEMVPAPVALPVQGGQPPGKPGEAPPAPVTGATPLPGAPAVAGVEKAQDTALNGAQVASAMEIVQAVARGELPRESGVAMLVEFFNIDPARAERVMGSVGKGFQPKEPEPVVVAPPPNPGDKPDLEEKQSAMEKKLGYLLGDDE